LELGERPPDNGEINKELKFLKLAGLFRSDIGEDFRANFLDEQHVRDRLVDRDGECEAGNAGGEQCPVERSRTPVLAAEMPARQCLEDHPDGDERRGLTVQNTDREQAGEPGPRLARDHEIHEHQEDDDVEIIPSIEPGRRQQKRETRLEDEER